jgi:hypothetical protein
MQGLSILGGQQRPLHQEWGAGSAAPCIGVLQARELQQKYEKKMKMLRDDLELRRKQVGGMTGSGCRLFHAKA